MNDFGDKLQDNSNHIRIATLNVRSFPQERKDSSKYDLFKKDMIESGANIIGLTEMNHNWRNVEESEQPHQQMRNWWKNKKISKSWMKSRDRDTWQQGGTATIITNEMTSHIHDSGEDSMRLGRCSWITLRDTAMEIFTTIITIYFPCTNIGTHTVYTQQLEAIRERWPEYTGTATDKYIDDLDKFIKSQISKGHQLIIMGDFNKDLNTNNKITTMMGKHGI